MSARVDPSSKLFEPIHIGELDLNHRVVLAPMSRFKASDEHVPLMPMVKDFYAQRATIPGTLIIAEATVISRAAGGFANVAGIWNEEQIDAWRQVTDAVHRKGSHIYLQLWAIGRVANPQYMEAHGLPIVSSGDIQAFGFGNPAKPRPLTVPEIEQYVEDFARATRDAMTAGFDGVELHSHNGFLLDSFIQDVANNRTDEYGGSIENRTRFVREVMAAVAAAAGGPSRVGIRLAPFSTFWGMGMADPVPQFRDVVRAARELGLAYVHLIEARSDSTYAAADQRFPDARLVERLDPFVDEFLLGGGGPAGGRAVLISGGFDVEGAQEEVDRKYAGLNVAVVFGRQFLANPDLVFRFRNGLGLNEYDRNTFYTTHSDVGFTDYPFSTEFLATSQATS